MVWKMCPWTVRPCWFIIMVLFLLICIIWSLGYIWSRPNWSIPWPTIFCLNYRVMKIPFVSQISVLYKLINLFRLVDNIRTVESDTRYRADVFGHTERKQSLGDLAGRCLRSSVWRQVLQTHVEKTIRFCQSRYRCESSECLPPFFKTFWLYDVFFFFLSQLYQFLLKTFVKRSVA